MPEPSSKPFPDALRTLMAEKKLSFRKVADLTSAGGGRSLSHGYVNQLATKLAKPTIENMEQLAHALAVEPTYFREYREHVAAQRAAVLAAELGLDVVLEKLAELDR